MAFFDDLGKKISSTSQNVMSKAKELVDISGLKSQISEEEKKINKYYSSLGKLYYDTQKENPTLELSELVGMIQASFNHIDELQLAITEIENANKCPNCGAVVEDDMLFCINCGAKLEKNEPQPEAEAQPVRYCINCGTQIQADALFCMNCGAKQE